MELAEPKSYTAMQLERNVSREICSFRARFSDTIEAVTVWCQSNLATLGKRRADRAEQIPMVCIPGFVDGVGGTEELHSNAARAQVQPRNLFVQSTLF